MAASDAVPVIIAAAIGAGGAVIAQVTTAVFTARRENARLTWEQERQAQEWGLRKAERFLTLKQELYSNYALLINNCLGYINERVGIPSIPLPSGEKRDFPDLTELERIKSNIDLIASDEVSRPVGMCYGAVVGAAYSASISGFSAEKHKKDADEGIEAWWKAYHAMRADLLGDEEALQRAIEIHGRRRKAPDAEAPTKQPRWRSVRP